MVDFASPYMPAHTDLAHESEVLRNLWQKGLLALQSLQTPLGITASGHNDHFHAIFGRDSLWTVLLALEADRLQQASQNTFILDTHVASYHSWLHDLSHTVLRGLASLQGRVVNDVNEEQPGRIVHEYWDPVPERMIAARWPVPRYYGAFDATFLFLITIHHVVEYFQDWALLDELLSGVELAFQWMQEWSDLDQDGLVEYARRNPEGIGLTNQVWKDSGESLRSPNHAPLVHPVAWIEVQGYAWAAYDSYRKMAERRHQLTPALKQTIERRKSRLVEGWQRFWMDEEQFPAIALDGDKQRIPAVSSNPGHLLWSGCLDELPASLVSKRLLQPDLFTPWGIRTLSDRAYYYNPLVYHCGAIWPFDNAVAALGMQRYGHHAEALEIAHRVLRALCSFEDPVELYTVHPSRWIRSHRIEHEWFLADYFYACSVQAWTAAAILYMTTLMLTRSEERRV